MSLATRSARSAIFLGASSISNIVIGFFGGIMLARLLAPNDFGTYALAGTLIAFGDLRAKLQLDQKFLRDRDERSAYLDTYFTVALGLSIISFALVLIGAAVVAALNRPDLAICLLVIAALNILDPLTSTIRLAIEKEVNFNRIAIIQSAIAISQFLLTLLAALSGLGLWSLLIGVAVNVSLNGLLFWRIAQRRPRLQLDVEVTRGLLAYGIKYGFVFAASSVVLTQFDNFIIGLISGTNALGFYDRAYRTALWPNLLLAASLSRITLPTYSKLQADPVRLRKAFSLVLWILLTCATPIALLFALTAPDFIRVIYGDKWLPSALILQMLAAFALLQPLSADLISILVATGRPGQMARLVFIQATVLVALAIPLTMWLGGVGTAFSVVSAYCVAALFLFYYARKHLQVRMLDTVAQPLLNGALTLIGYLIIRPLLAIENAEPLRRFSVDVILLFGLYTMISLLLSRATIRDNVRYLVQVTRG